MSKKAKAVKPKEKERCDDTGLSNEWWIILMLMLAIPWGIPAENPKISELEKKVARLEGQMSMIGGKLHE